MNTSEVLNRAADLIEERGWGQGEGWNEQPEAQGLCLEGGIMAALGLSYTDDAEGEGTPDGFTTCPAYVAVRNYLGLSGINMGSTLWWWNDDTGRTATEVVEVLRAAAVIEAAKETADERESVTA